MPTAREVAYLSLERCEKQNKYSNLEVDAQIKRFGLDGAEKGLYVSLVYGVIERKITLDFLISTLSARPMEKLDIGVLTALRLGLYQLIFTDKIPESAAVNESVKLAGKYTGTSAKGFVNAILRGFLRSTEGKRPDSVEELLKFPAYKKHFDRLGHYARTSVLYSYPQWLCEKLAVSYLPETAESVMRAQNENKSTTYRVNTLRTDRESVVSSIGGAEPTRFSPFGITSDHSARIERMLSDGEIFVQDEASQIASMVLDCRPGETVLDCCACPGGKSFASAMLMENRGRIFSFDLHESKLSLIKSGCERLGIEIIKASVSDSSKFDDALATLLGEGADRVLCDVPCSGLGVISKKPEIRYKSREDINKLPEIQLKILKNCSRYVRPGGILVYSTCTLNPDENENNVKAFLDQTHDFETLDFELAASDGAKIKSNDGMVTLFPHIYNTDGFFIAKMRRKL